MTKTLYRIDPSLSHLSVQAFATGMLSFMGHSPTFTVRDYAGTLGFDDDRIAGLHVELLVRAGALALVDRVSASDRQEIEGRMDREVLESATFPEIAFQSTETSIEPVGQGHYRAHINGSLELHGIRRPQPLAAELRIFKDGVRLSGETRLRMSEYNIRPVTALGGTIRLKDELKVMFDVAAAPEAS